MESFEAIPTDQIYKMTGPIFIGNILNWALFGVLAVQSYLYYLAFPRDKKLPKSIVVAVFLIEVVQTVLCTMDGFRIFGYGYSQIAILFQIGFFSIDVPLLSGLVSGIVQYFFAWRIRIIGNSYVMPSIISVLPLTQVTACFVVGIQGLIFSDNVAEVTRRNRIPTSIWLTTTAIADVFITGSMFFYISRSRNGFRATNVIVAKLIRLTIETGLVTSAMAVFDLVLFLKFDALASNYYLTPAMVLSKMYSNNLLVLLDSRIRNINGREIGYMAIDNTLSWDITTSGGLQATIEPITFRVATVLSSVRT